jgi:hypothetical protein
MIVIKEEDNKEKLVRDKLVMSIAWSLDIEVQINP